jgi:subfamily B ATP-binding cassette protein MsbA
MRKIFRMLRFATPYKRRILFFLFTSVGYSACHSLPIYLIREYLGVVFESRAAYTLWTLTWILTAAWLFRAYFLVRRQVTEAYILRAAQRDAQDRLMAHILRQPLGFFDRWRTGELLARIGKGTGGVGTMVGASMLLVKEPLTIIAILGVIIYMNWKLALIGIVGFPLAFWPLVALMRRIRRIALQAQRRGAARSDSVIQTFTGMQVVKGFRRGEYEAGRLKASNEELFGLGMKQARTVANLRGLVEIINGIGALGVVVAGGFLVIHGHLTGKELLAFLFALVALHGPVKSLSGVNATIQGALVGGERFFELLDIDETLPAPEHPVRIERLSEAIRFKNVGFSYGREEVLKDVDLEIEAGKATAIVGPSGSGKSSVLKLLMRAYDPTSGSVQIDGVDLRHLDQAGWLDGIGIVTQEPLLFNTSITENVLYGKLDASPEEIREAARVANIHDDIMKLPQGYDTLAGERGGQLSGGQRQRVCLARSLVRNPMILILDEATSSLDSVAEKTVQKAIARAQVGRTSVVVAHRLSTVMDAERIYVLVDGHIEAFGRHQELIERSPTYGRLWRIQQGAGVESA